MKTIVVIGGGPAGLTAAYQLVKSNDKLQVILLEASNQVGGISKTVTHYGNRIDLGGHRFFSKSEEINRLWLELLPLQGKAIDSELEEPQRDTYPGKLDPNIMDNVMLLRRRVSRIYYNKKFFDYPISIDISTLKKLGFCKSIKCCCGYLFSSVFRRSGDSLEDFYINRFGKPLYDMFFKDYTTKLWGVTPDKLDSSWGAQRVKKLSLLKIVTDFFARTFISKYRTSETSLIEEFYYPKYGPGQLWEQMAINIQKNGGLIYYNSVCKEIKCEGKLVKAVNVEFEDGSSRLLECDYLISSAPIKDLINMIDEDVPAEIKRISDGLPYRDFITVGVLLERVCLSNKTRSIGRILFPHDCWIYVQDKGIKIGRIQIFNNWSPYLVKNPKDTIWLGLEYFCTENDEFWLLDDKDIKQFALDELTKMNIISEISVLDSVVIRQKKAYPAYYGVYKSFDEIREYLLEYSNLICVGRNGQHRYNNMDHSMLTGLQAVKYIQGQAEAISVWEINSEQEYHEEGKMK